MISLIIPTKNESRYLPLIVESINEQSFNDLEIIVADAESTDETRKIAQLYGCKVIRGGLPAYGRNRGAEKSKGDMLAFIDADVILPDRDFINNSLYEFIERDLDIAGTLQKPISTGNSFLDYLYNIGYEEVNDKMKMNQNKKHKLMQVCMFAKKEVFSNLGGFREDIKFGEDSELAKRAGQKGYKFGILGTPGKVWLSTRRFEKEGRLTTLAKCIYFNVGRKLGHEFLNGKGKIKYFRD